MKLSIIIKSLLVLPLLAAPAMSFAQQYQKLFDIDSSYDWPGDIFLQPDSNYFVIGELLNPVTGNWGLFNTIISADGNTILSKHILQNSNNSSLYPGTPQQTKKILNGYIAPLSITYNYDTTYRATAGLIKYNNAGDTIFIKKYTDTSLYFSAIAACSIMPDGGYIIGGYKDFNVPSYYPAYLIRTDSVGDTLWTHSYRKFTNQWGTINNIIPLTDGRIVIAAMTTQLINLGPPDYNEYYYNRPWFLVLDALGNVLKDTVYSNGYMVSGGLSTATSNMYKDINGGYIQIGSYDSLYTSDPSDFTNFPGYIAHLDTNFRITWITSFPYNDAGHRQPMYLKQLKDSSYVVMGDNWDYYGCGTWTWATKITPAGAIAWQHIYHSDTTHCAYIVDAIERPNGNLLFIGTAMNDSLPVWHTSQDMWLIGVDSNGCDEVNCGVVADTATQVGSVVKNGKFSVYPNPTNSILNFEFPASGNVTIKLMDITGRVLDRQEIANGTTASFSVRGYTAGLYLYQVITAGNTQSGKFIVK